MGGKNKTESFSRLVFAMDLADDIRAQKEIHAAKHQIWEAELTPVGKENTDEVT